MKLVILVFLGGAIGSIAREALMVYTPAMADQFPMDIFAANIIAAFLLGLAAAWFARKKMGDDSYLFIGTGIMGGLSTFSSFAYGAVAIMSESTPHLLVGIAYVILSLVVGYGAVRLGYKLGSGRKHDASVT